jgi:hypothetical protein
MNLLFRRVQFASLKQEHGRVTIREKGKKPADKNITYNHKLLCTLLGMPRVGTLYVNKHNGIYQKRTREKNTRKYRRLERKPL